MNRVDTNGKIKIGHINTRSLFAHFDEVSSLILDKDYEIMCLSETWLNEYITDQSITVPGYKLHRCDRKDRGGGVGIYFKTYFHCHTLDLDFDAVCNGVENIWLKVEFGQHKILVGVIYRAQSGLLNDFIEFLDLLLSFITAQFDNIIILGDINVDQAYDNNVNQCMSSYDFVQLIPEPTRVTNTSGSIIDVIFVNNQTIITILEY